MVMRIFNNIGGYFMMLGKLFSRPDKISVFIENTRKEMIKLGFKSLGIVVIMSVFMGSVIVIQSATAINSPLIPDYAVGYTAKQSIILEFSPTIMCLILAGKIGSNISSELGTMRISEQIDAIEMMGINSVNLLVGPKVLACVLMFPIIVVISMFFAFCGGMFVSMTSDLITEENFLIGIRLYSYKNTFFIIYALVKTVVFAFLISSISSYFGYYVKGGSLEVGKSSTSAVVYSSIFILFFNLIITQLLLI